MSIMPLPEKQQPKASWYRSLEEAYDAAADLLTEKDLYEYPEEIEQYAKSSLNDDNYIV